MSATDLSSALFAGLEEHVNPSAGSLAVAVALNECAEVRETAYQELTFLNMMFDVCMCVLQYQVARFPFTVATTPALARLIQRD